MATEQWIGPSGTAWATDGDWASGGAPSAPPTAADTAVLASGDSGTITGPGSAGALDVAGTYTLTGTIAIDGTADVAGQLALVGSSVAAAATLATIGATVSGAIELTVADWTDSGTVAIGAGGLVSLRDAAALAGSVIAVAAGGVFDIGPAAAVTAATVISDGLLIALGSLTATSLTLAAGSDAIAQGDLRIGTLTVAPGALLGGAPLITGAAGAAANVINNGTIEGAVAAAPLEISGGVSGTGTLLIDGGGGLQLDGAVAAGQTVVFAPGESPIYIDSDGAAGGELVLNDVTQFAGTLSGLATGDRLYVAPVGTDAVAAAVLDGDSLELKDSGGTVLARIALTDSNLPSDTTFLVGPASPSDLFAPPDAAAGAVEITAIPPGGLQLTSAGAVTQVAGVATTVPPLTALDPAGWQDGDTFTLTLQANTGTFSELLSLPLLFGGTYTSFAAGLAAGGGDATVDLGPEPSGVQDETLSVSGTGTGTLTITSQDLFLLDFQASFVTYAAAHAGSGSISVGFSNGVSAVAATVPVLTTDAPVSFAWVTGGSGNAYDPANWTSASAAAGPPVAGDPVTLGAGAYSITGDIAAGALTVTGNALTQGAIYLSGTASGPSLLVQGGGIFGSAGFIDVQGSAAVGVAGSGELDLVGPINQIVGDLIVGDGAAGYFRSDGLVSVTQDVLVGLASAGQLDVTADPLAVGSGAGLLSFIAGLNSVNGVLGAGAGQQGYAAVDGGVWTLSGTLTVGGAGTGVLELAIYPGYGEGEVHATALVIGAQASGAGTVENAGGLYITNSISFGPGANGLLVNTGNIELGTQDEASAPGTLTIGGVGGDDTLLTELELDADVITIGAGGTLLGQAPAGASFIDATDVSVAAGGTLALTHTNLDGGSLTVRGGTAGFLDTAPDLTGAITLSDDATYVQQGANGAAGALSVAAGSLASFGAGAGLNLGSLYVGGNLSLAGGTLNLSGGATIAAGGLVSGDGAIGTGYAGPPVAPINNSGTIAAQGGTLTLLAPLITDTPGGGVLAIGPDATMVLTGTPDATQTITFAADATLQVGAITAVSADDPPPTTVFEAPLDGFGSGGDAVLFNQSGLYSILGYAGGVLSLLVTDPYASYNASANAYVSGSGTLDLTIPSAPSAAAFMLTGIDPSYNADAEVDSYYTTELTETVTCFRAGTRLRTPDGEVAVERLAVGDTVLTVDGAARPVTWIGHRQVDCARHRQPARVCPVRIAAHAFGPGCPARVLFLSPDHGVFVDDVLIPVKYLINGTTVRQVPAKLVTYYHVELSSHAILLAEGLPAESFLDTGNRAAFMGGPVRPLAPDFAPRVWEAQACAAVRMVGPEVDAARARLARAVSPRVGCLQPTALVVDGGGLRAAHPPASAR